jgi:hypothetical protein
MFEGPPRERPWVSWLYVVSWSLFIYVTIPLALYIQRFVAERWGKWLFVYVVLAFIAVALVVSITCVIRHRATIRGRYLWLLAVAAIFSWYTLKLGQKFPAEGIHFVQYGVLSVLVYRALTHRFQDVSVYFAAVIICAMIGTIDELIQWITPGRRWDLKDVWINFFGAFLVQVALAKGLNPKFIDNRLSRPNLRYLLRLSIAAILLLWACLMNTPNRTVWIAERVPWLAFLKDNESVILEYGYLYHHRDTGFFRSRLTFEELRLNDRTRGKEAAEILDRYQDRKRYLEFLKIYTPVRDPFVHEARVHLFSRDVHFSEATKCKDDPENYAKHLTIAFRENRIMERHFSNTLQNSGYVWSADQRALARGHLVVDLPRQSGVSRYLVTRVREAHLVLFFASLLVVLAIPHWYLGRGSDTP